MFNNIGDLAAAGTIRGSIGGMFSGLILSKNAPWVATDFLQLQLKVPGEGTEIIMNRQNLLGLGSVIGARTGHSFELQEELTAADAGAVTTDSVNFSMLVDLGLLDLRNGGRLEVAMVGAEAKAYSLDTCLLPRTGHMVPLKWIESATLRQKIDRCVEVWLVNTTDTISAPADETLSVTVQPPQGAFESTAMGIFGGTGAALNSVAGGPLHAACIHQSIGGLPMPVDVNITGASSGDYKLLIIEPVLRSRLVSRTRMEGLRMAAQVLENMSPEEVRTVKRAGIVGGGPRELRKVLSSMNEK